MESIKQYAFVLKTLPGSPSSSSSTTTKNIQNTVTQQPYIHTQSEEQLVEVSSEWNHWKNLPSDLLQMYDWLLSGVEVIHTVITKLTLISAMNIKQVHPLTLELNHACQVITTATVAFYQSSSSSSSLGCALPTQSYVRQPIRSLVASILTLLEMIVRDTTTTTTTTTTTSETVTEDNNNLSRTNHPEKKKNLIVSKQWAQQTGVVWDACQVILEKKCIPKGNRNCVRRQLLTFMNDCKDTMIEFEQLLLGSTSKEDQKDQQEVEEVDPENVQKNEIVKEEEEEEGDMDLFTTLHYTRHEIPWITISLSILTFSKTLIRLTLDIMEWIGAYIEQDISMNNNNNDGSSSIHRTSSIGGSHTSVVQFTWMKSLYHLIYWVGFSVTDLGFLLYPPLDLLPSLSTTTNTIITTKEDYNTIIDKRIIIGQDHQEKEVEEKQTRLQQHLNPHCPLSEQIEKQYVYMMAVMDHIRTLPMIYPEFKCFDHFNNNNVCEDVLQLQKDTTTSTPTSTIQLQQQQQQQLMEDKLFDMNQLQKELDDCITSARNLACL